ncbi:MAG TPA: GNAT family N-acetyltransferase [Anaerolineales bacterium]|nr:GNAT family N-acetyltransferase [Anaerolineales bacterium]
MFNVLIRHYVPAMDLLPLSQLLTEIESIDCDGEDTSQEYLRSALSWHNYRPDQDVWVAEVDGKLVGYAVALEQPSRHCTVYGVVHPSCRRNGLGSQLLALTLERAREVDSQDILVYANEHNVASNLFLKQQQFQQVGSSGVMKAPSALEIPPYEFPQGFALKRYSEVNEPRILLEALNVCYLDMWGHQHQDKRSEEELRSPRFLKYYDADDILLLFDEQDSVLGICSVKSEARKAEDGNFTDLLDAPGILKEYRERGFQHPLVLAAIQHLRRKGTRPITLEFWGDSENALNIYRGLGFEMAHHYLAYHKELN